MKPLLLLTLCLAVAGCGQESNQREVLDRLRALETEMAKRPAPVRWAYANKRKITAAIYERTREKLADLKKADALPPEVEAQVAHYETLRSELIRLSILRTRSALTPPLQSRSLPTVPPSLSLPLPNATAPAPVTALPPPAPPAPPVPTEEEKAYAEITRRVAEAKAPVAAIVERRDELSAKYRDIKFPEQLIANYVKQKEHYDLVVDSSNDYAPTRSVLYHTASEVPDITEGVIQFFRDKEKR